MAGFDFGTAEIIMSDAYGGRSFTISDIQQIPTAADPTMSMVHEYVHFLQLLSGLCGFRLFAELIDFGIAGALVLSGQADAKNDATVTGYRQITSLLQAQPDNAGASVPDLLET